MQYIVLLKGGVCLEAQMKRGFLEACVLRAVYDEESYGYRIIKDVPSCMGLSESTLYPLLKRLEQGGYISVRKTEHQGRIRKYYKITSTGKARVQEFLNEWPSIQEIYQYVGGEKQ